MQRNFTKWIRVTHKNKCPICDHGDWCGISEDGDAVICMRVKSDKGTKNEGWLHVLREKPVFVPRVHKSAKPETPANTDFSSMIAEWQSDTGKEQFSVFALALGITPNALVKIGACYSRRYGAWAFPMKDGRNNIIGIRLRATDSRKWAVKGSAAGLFYGMFECPDYVLVCEGPTDTAAACSAGFDAIGRPSCRGQENFVIEVLRPYYNAKLAIIADNDVPGIEGARKLAASLKRPVRIIIPPAKDIREWVRTGAGRCEIVSACKNAKVLNVK